MEFFGTASCVHVEGFPVEAGDIAYGPTVPEVGSEVTYKAFDGEWTNAADDTKATCKGYVLYAMNASGEDEIIDSGEGTSVTFTVREGTMRVVWQFDATFKCTVISGGNGSVSGDAWIKNGGEFVPTAVADDGYGFFKWTANAPVDPYATSFKVHCPLNAVAVFAPIVNVTAGDNVVSAALAEIAAGTPTILSLGAGTYKESAAVSIDKPVHLIGESLDGVVCTFKGLYGKHEDALFKNMTLSGGQSGHGGNLTLETGGIVEDCILKDGKATSWDGKGGNLRILSDKCIARRCKLIGGSAAGNYGGVAVWANAGVLENCLITDCTPVAKGAVYLAGSAKVVNCTVAGIKNSANPIFYIDSKATGSIVNTVIANNGLTPVTGTMPSLFDTCLTDGDDPINETCQVSKGALFVDAEKGDFSVSVDSALRDVGKDYGSTGASSLTDLAGNERVSNGKVDIGCYEFQFSGLMGDFRMTSTRFGVPARISFEAIFDSVVGEITYEWDFDNDGTVDLTTTDATVSHVYEAMGTYSVKIVASDGQNRVERLHADAFTIGPGVMYVSDGNANAEYPYATEETAAPDVATAVAAAVSGSEVRVLPVEGGSYRISGPISVNCGVTIVGMGESPDAVVLSNTRDVSWNTKDSSIFKVNHKDALIANLKMQNGKIYYDGGNVTIFENGGTVSNCVISAGMIRENDAGGANVAIKGADGLVTHCIIENGRIDNNAGQIPTRAAGVYMTAGRLENCLVRGNYVTAGWYSNGAIVAAGKSKVLNCTVVGNSGQNNEFTGIRLQDGAEAVNCAMFGNTRVNEEGKTASASWAGVANNFSSCASENLERINESCLLITAAAFKKYEQGNYVPKSGGALTDKGVTPEGWKGITDLAGKPRVIGKAVDIGCYEGNSAGLILNIK